MVNPDEDLKSQNVRHQGNRSLNFLDVFSEYQHLIYNYTLRMTLNQAIAEDLTQENFIRVHRNLPSFRGEASYRFVHYPQTYFGTLGLSHDPYWAVRIGLCYPEE